MSKIYEKESQYIVRFPPDIAKKLQSYFDIQKKNALASKLINDNNPNNNNANASNANPNLQQINLNQLPSQILINSTPNATQAQSAQPNASQGLPQMKNNESTDKQKENIIPDINIPQISFMPKIVKDEETGLEKLQFDIAVDDFRSKGSLIDLPCTLETYKTEDTINIFKSNDTKQMIYVHLPNEDEVPATLAKKKEVLDKETNEKVIKYESYHGLTPPTYYIKKRFYRKKPILDKAEVQEVEKIMVKIQKEITKNDKEPERTKRKYKKRY